MRGTIIQVVFFFVMLAIALHACKQDPELVQPVPVRDLHIDLKWNKAYSTETPQQVEIGLQWCFSYLGAALPPATYSEGFSWRSQQVIRIDAGKLGFNDKALHALGQLIGQLKHSDEYVKTGSVDLGRFVMLTINAPNHYYKITGAEENYPAFRSRFVYDAVKVAILESSVSKVERLLRLPFGNEVTRWGFIAAHGSGTLRDGSFAETEHEVFDVMPNGQLRFALYDEHDKLMPAANAMLTDAGKPAKCLWCHEIVIQRSFNAVTSLPDYYPIDTFTSIVAKKMERLTNYRASLSSKLDFTKRQDHTQMELLYISFMEPSAERLANEWNMSVPEVKNKLSGLNTHLHSEFLYLGDLYHRKEVDAFSPFSGVRVPDDAREKSAYEPDLIH